MVAQLPDPATRFSQLSGHPILDLMNTVDWRLDPGRSLERLQTMDDVLDWCLLTGLVDQDEHAVLRDVAAGHPRIARREHSAVLAWRELAYDAVVTRSRAAMQAVVEAYREVVARAVLRPAGPSEAWTWQDTRVDLTTVRDRLVRATIDLVTRPDVPLIHQCEDDACGWVFLDTSPRHNRRWCSASGCGNRNRARRFNQRRRTPNDREEMEQR
jgi:predicted RNA-binding Zn ribbon-like protein